MLDLVMGGLAVELVKKGTITLYQDLKRLKSVHAAFKDPAHPPLDEVVEVSLRDMERVFGSYAGILTQPLKDFIVALHNSTLPARMIEMALLNIEYPHLKQKSPGALAAFGGLFTMHFPSGAFEVPIASRMYDLELNPKYKKDTYNVNELFELMSEMMAASIRASRKMSGVRSFIESRLYRTIAAAADDRLLNYFAPHIPGNSNLRVPAKWLSDGPPEPWELLKRIAANSLHLYSKLWVEGPEDRGQRDVSSDQIFTPTPLAPLLDTPDRLGRRTGDSFLYKELRLRYHRAVILGDPGVGKSTLSRMFCRDILVACLDGAGAVAITVTIRKYESTSRNEPALTIFDFVVRELALHTSIEKQHLDSALRYYLGLGLITIIIDGIDEILRVDRRRDVAALITGFCAAFPLTPVYVTSRRVGYTQAPLALSEFPIIELEGFSQRQSEEYFRKHAAVIFRKSETEATEDCRRFFQSISEGSELCRNPLMLGLMVWLFYERRGNLPNDRARLYREWSLLMFQRWDELRGIESGIPPEFDFMHFLEYLASRLYLEPELAGGVPRSWLKTEAYKFFQSRFIHDANARAAHAANEVIKFVTGRAWVMTDIGEGVYDFTHRTFLEYFFARHLRSEYETVSELVSVLEGPIANGIWQVPAHLALQENIAGRIKSSMAVAQKLVEGFSSHMERFPDSRSDILEFCVASLEYLHAPEQEIEQLSRMIGRWGVTLENSVELFDRVLSSLNPRRLGLSVGLARGITEALIRPDAEPDSVSRACDWAYALKLSTYERGTSNPQTNDFVQEWCKLFPVALTLGSTAAGTKWLFDFKGEIADEASQFGLRLWTADRPFYQRTNFLGTDLKLMAIELQKHSKSGVAMRDLPYARLAVAIAAELRNQAPIPLPKDSRSFNRTPEKYISWISFFEFNWSDLFDVNIDEFGMACITNALLCYELNAREEFRDLLNDSERGIIGLCMPSLGKIVETGGSAENVDFIKRYYQRRLTLLR
jgi:NACHT domain